MKDLILMLMVGLVLWIVFLPESFQNTVDAVKGIGQVEYNTQGTIDDWRDTQPEHVFNQPVYIPAPTQAPICGVNISCQPTPVVPTAVVLPPVVINQAVDTQTPIPQGVCGVNMSCPNNLQGVCGVTMSCENND